MFLTQQVKYKVYDEDYKIKHVSRQISDLITLSTGLV